MRRLWLVGVLVAVLLAVAWWFFFIAPRNTKISEANDEVARLQDMASVLTVQLGQLRNIRDHEVEYLAAIGKLEALIPERPLLEEFIEQINELAETTGVELRTLAPALPIALEDSDLRQISVSCTLEGEFFEVIGFLFGLSEMDRLVRVDGIAVSSGQDEAGATILSVNLTIRLFTLADLLPLAPEAALDAGGGDDGGGQANEASDEGAAAGDNPYVREDPSLQSETTTTTGGGG